jgi:hypothetical protein
MPVSKKPKATKRCFACLQKAPNSKQGSMLKKVRQKKEEKTSVI